jgi:hypothetical protein
MRIDLNGMSQQLMSKVRPLPIYLTSRGLFCNQSLEYVKNLDAFRIRNLHLETAPVVRVIAGTVAESSDIAKAVGDLRVLSSEDMKKPADSSSRSSMWITDWTAGWTYGLTVLGRSMDVLQRLRHVEALPLP